MIWYKKRNTEYLTECFFNVNLQKPLISLLSLYPVDYSGFLQNQNFKKNILMVYFLIENILSQWVTQWGRFLRF